MAILLPTRFSAYQLTDEEVLQGSILNGLQLQVMQNHLSVYAEERLSLDYNPEHKEQFLQAEARLKGIIEILSYLMDSSDTSLEVLTNQRTNDTGE